MRIRTIIADDEVLARRKVRSFLGAHPEFEIVAECGAGRETVSRILELKPHLLFLDIRMPELDGFEVLSKVEPGLRPAVIITTAYDEYAVAAFAACALDYLLKPFNRGRFEQAIQKFLAQGLRHPVPAKVSIFDWLSRWTAAPERDRLAVKENGRISIVDTRSVRWIQSERDYIRLHAGKQTYLVRKTMDGIERELNPRRFLRIHRSAIINVEFVADLKPVPGGDYRVSLKDGTVVTMSRSFRKRAARLPLPARSRILNSEPRVRRAEEADAGAIAEVLRQAFAEYRSRYTEQGFSATTPDASRILARMREGRVWVVLERDCIAGTVSAVLKGSQCYVRGMAVLPEVGRRGIGQLLLGRVEEFAVAAGARWLTLSTTPFLDRAISLYQRFGFHRTSEGPHDLFGTPLFTMTKDLRNTRAR